MRIKSLLFFIALSLLLIAVSQTNIASNKGENDQKNIVSTSRPLQSLLSDITGNVCDVDEKIRRFNPNAILQEITQDLSNLKKATTDWEQQIQNSILKGIFAFNFHWYMTGTAPEKMSVFLTTLKKVACSQKRKPQTKRRQGNPFLGLPNLNSQQRKLLLFLDKRNYQNITDAPQTLLTCFFVGKQEVILKKMIINITFPLFKSAIMKKCQVQQLVNPIFAPNNLMRSDQLLKYANRFRCSVANEFCYQRGADFFAAQKYQSAALWFQEAGDLGHLKAMHDLACAYGDLGMLNDKKKSLELFKKAADLGLPDAMFHFSILLRQESDIKNADKYLKMAAERNLVDAINELGSNLRGQGDIKTAKQCYQKGITLKSARSKFLLALLIDEKEDDAARARKYYIEAADEGDELAQYWYGRLLLKEASNTEALKRAKKYLQSSWGKGVAMAGHDLAVIEMRLGNQDKCLPLIKEAAKLGISASIYCLGWYYLEDEGQVEKARGCCQKAVNENHHPALLPLAITSEKLNKQQEAEDYFLKAIKFGVKDAEIFYANFLTEQGRNEEARNYIDFHEVQDDQVTASDSSEKQDSTDKSENNSQDKTLEIAADTSEMYDYPSVEVKKKYEPICSKRLQKYFERAKKRQKEPMMLPSQGLQQNTKWKTYKDVVVSISPSAQADINATNESIIQGLISCLANGEPRAQFKYLKGDLKGLCSMRRTQGDRLVFTIEKGSMQEDVTAINVVAVKGHYKRTPINTKFFPIKWKN